MREKLTLVLALMYVSLSGFASHCNHKTDGRADVDSIEYQDLVLESLVSCFKGLSSFMHAYQQQSPPQFIRERARSPHDDNFQRQSAGRGRASSGSLV